MSAIVFSVPGIPVTQGSKKAMRRKRSPFAYVVDQSDMKTKRGSNRLKKWRAAMTLAAKMAMRGNEMLMGDVELTCELVFDRPPSHFLKSGRIAKRALKARPNLDLSKLIRAVEDSMNKVVYRDDVQIVQYGAGTRKRYADGPEDFVGVRILVRPLEES